MKNCRIYKQVLSFIQLAIFIFFSTAVIGQVDTVKSEAADTAVASTNEKKTKKDKFIIYGGANFNTMGVTSSQIESTTGVGYHLGFAYKRGNFFYWQVGARYNSAAFNFVKTSTNADTSKLTVNAFDVPLTAGINFLSFADRIVALRVFVSAVPSFTVGVGDNNLNIEKDNVNSFILYGQAGLGVDIAFFMIETGYNYGFQNILKDYSSSNPGQFFVSLGFRF